MVMTHTLGVAIPVPDPHGADLQQWRERFGDPTARIIPPHVTLLPPINVSGGDFEKVDEHLRGVAASEPPFRMFLRGTATFRPVSPVVFVQVALGIGDCERIEQKVRNGPLDRDLEFPYHPHVTVAHDLPDEVLDVAFDELASYRADFVVNRFSLYEHGTDGVWRPVRTYPLAAPA